MAVSNTAATISSLSLIRIIPSYIGQRNDHYMSHQKVSGITVEAPLKLVRVWVTEVSLIVSSLNPAFGCELILLKNILCVHERTCNASFGLREVSNSGCEILKFICFRIKLSTQPRWHVVQHRRVILIIGAFSYF